MYFDKTGKNLAKLPVSLVNLLHAVKTTCDLNLTHVWFFYANLTWQVKGLLFSDLLQSQSSVYTDFKYGHLYVKKNRPEKRQHAKIH